MLFKSKKTRNIAITVMIALFLSTMPFVLSYTKKNHEEKVKAEATVLADDVFMDQVNNEEDNERLVLRTNSKTLSNYRKMLNGEDYEVLVISNSDIDEFSRYKSKPSWQVDLEEELNGQETFAVTFENITLNGGSLAWALLLNRYHVTNYDFDYIIVEVDKSNEEQLKTNEFELVYERLLRDIKEQYGDVDIITVLDYEVDLSGQYYDKIVSIGEYYEVTTIQNYNGELVSGEEIFLTADNELIIEDEVIAAADLGSSFEEYIGKDVKVVSPIALGITEIMKNSQKRIKSLNTFMPEAITNIELLDEMVLKLQPNDYRGFEIDDDIIRSSSLGDYVSYNTNKNFLILTYATHPKGALMEVLIEDEVYVTIDTKSSYMSTESVVVMTEDKVEKVVRLETVERELEIGEDEFVVVFSLSSN